MSEPTAYRFDVNHAAGVLADLHEQVIRCRRRIELTRGDETCILLSKAELDALDRALEILADTDEFRAISQKIAHLAGATQNFATLA